MTVGRDDKSVSAFSIHKVIVSASLYLDYTCCPERSSYAVGSVTYSQFSCSYHIPLSFRYSLFTFDLIKDFTLVSFISFPNSLCYTVSVVISKFPSPWSELNRRSTVVRSPTVWPMLFLCSSTLVVL